MYNLYTVYMEQKVYKLAEFRKCTRQAFDLAEGDTDVIIERYDKRFVLISETFYKYLINPSEENNVKHNLLTLESEDLESSIEVTVDPAKFYKPDIKPCKHGADPRFCKFAKNGKPCK